MDDKSLIATRITQWAMSIGGVMAALSPRSHKQWSRYPTSRNPAVAVCVTIAVATVRWLLSVG